MSDYWRFLEELVEYISFTFCSRLWAESFDLQSCKIQTPQGCSTFPCALCVPQPRYSCGGRAKGKAWILQRNVQIPKDIHRDKKVFIPQKSLLIPQNIKIPLWKEAKDKWSWEVPRERYKERVLSLTSLHLQEEVNCLSSHMSSSPTFSFD